MKLITSENDHLKTVRRQTSLFPLGMDSLRRLRKQEDTAQGEFDYFLDRRKQYSESKSFWRNAPTSTN